MSEPKQAVEGLAGLKASVTTTSLQGVDRDVAAQTASDLAHKLEMQRLELEAARLSIQEKTANLEDLRERLAEREMKREMLRMKARTNGQTLAQLLRGRLANQAHCNHQKGGMGAAAVVAGQGDDSQHCVAKHSMANGDMWVWCLRCHKTWKPPMEEDFETREGYLGAFAEYQTAVNFQTRNVPSASTLFKWGDNGTFYRRSLKNSGM